MLTYPQLSSGALMQFPVRKRRQLRTVVNTAADGSSIKLADPNAETSQWSLSYAQLTDAEVGALQQFFTDAEGTLNAFTFIDPTANLLAWSDHLDNAVWIPGPQLAVAGGIADPVGATNAWHLANPSGAAQNIAQTLAVPTAYTYCFSVYVRSAQPLTATMVLGSHRFTQPVTSNWTRLVCSGTGDSAAQNITFALELPAGAAVDVYGMQVEAQAGASVYKASTTGGIYENARLGSDALSITTTGVNQHSCTVSIFYAKHL